MNKKLRKIPASLALTAALWVVPLTRVATAQEAAGSTQETPPPPQRSVLIEPPVERDSSGRARVKFERGTKVFVGNKTTGRIVVTGWDRDYIEATATSQNGIEYVWVGATNDAAGPKILLKADYANAVDMETRRIAALEQRRKEIEQRRLELEARQREAEARQREAEARLRKAEERRNAQRGAARTRDDGTPPSDATVPAPSATPSAENSQTIQAPPSASVSAPSGGPGKLRGPGQVRLKAPDIDFQMQIQNQIQNQLQTQIQPSFGDIDIEVKVPRAAEIDLIKVIRSEVEITGVETAVTVHGDRSLIKLSRVGAVEVRTRSGRVEIEDVRGLVDVITSSGSIKVSRAGGDVRALSLSGDVSIHCVQGRVDVNNTNGAVTLVGIDGDVDATTTNSEVRFAGAIRQEGRYHLKSMSGPVEMSVSEDAPGFTALLSSYRGGVKTDFQLQFKEPWNSDPRHSGSGNRLIGRYGNGQAQITLDSFDGGIRLGKLARNEMKECR